MDLIRKLDSQPVRLGIFPGTFNPPTKAHLALAQAALALVDEVLFVLPRAFPHKQYGGTTREERLEMLRTATAREPRFSIGLTDTGLFIDIAREARYLFPDAVLYFLCGRDAADRIVNWNYGQPGAIREMLREFRLLVAPRRGRYMPPPELRFAIEQLPETDFENCSATIVRDRIARGEDWRTLVPAEIIPLIEQFYGKNPAP